MATSSKTTAKTKGFDGIEAPENYLVAGPREAAHQTANAAQYPPEAAKQQRVRGREARLAESDA